MAASNIIQIVKAHVPLIKFPHRLKGVPNALHHASPAALDQPGPSPLDAPAKSAPPSSSSKPVGSTHRGSGIEFKDLPQRYQRKPLDQQEIDFITRGGPE